MKQYYHLFKAVKDGIVLKEGITTSNGNAGGTTLIDSTLTEPDSYWSGTVVILDGANRNQKRDISSFTQLTNTVTVGSAFDAQILSGVKYQIISFEPAEVEVAAIQAVVDTILLDAQLKFAVSGSKTIASGVEKHLDIDSGTDGAEIVSITIKGIVGAEWTIEGYIPTDDAVAAPAAGDKRFEESYINTDTEGGQLAGIGAIRYNMFLDITNDSAGPDDIDEVIIAYRSRGTVTATWEA